MTRPYTRRRIPMQSRPLDEHPQHCRCSACTAYAPTPDEIRQRAAEIRAGWSDATELSRRAVKPTHWSPPTATVTGID